MDRFLVEQAQRGDREAFTTLAFELSDRLFAVAHRILRDSAGDALQVTLLNIWRDLPSLRNADLIESWSYRILVRACHDQLRTKRRRAPALHLYPRPAVEQGPDVHADASEQADQVEGQRGFRR